MKRLPDIITLDIITANGLGVSWSALWSWWVHRDPSAFLLRENALILFGHNPYQHLSGDQRHVPIGILDRRLYSTQDSIDKYLVWNSGYIDITTTKVKIKDDGF